MTALNQLEKMAIITKETPDNYICQLRRENGHIIKKKYAKGNGANKLTAITKFIKSFEE